MKFKRGVQHLLGVATYLVKFLPTLSTSYSPLWRLPQKDAKFDSLTQYKESVTKLKKLITETPELRHYDANNMNKDAVIMRQLGSLTWGQCHAKRQTCGIYFPSSGADRTQLCTDREGVSGNCFCNRVVQTLHPGEEQGQSCHKPLTPIFNRPGPASLKRQGMRLLFHTYTLNVPYKPGSLM